jgi:hypothetical protein
MRRLRRLHTCGAGTGVVLAGRPALGASTASYTTRLLHTLHDTVASTAPYTPSLTLLLPRGLVLHDGASIHRRTPIHRRTVSEGVSVYSEGAGVLPSEVSPAARICLARACECAGPLSGRSRVPSEVCHCGRPCVAPCRSGPRRRARLRTTRSARRQIRDASTRITDPARGRLGPPERER